jgi:hypothetical protein
MKMRKTKVKKNVKLTLVLAPETYALLQAECNGPIFRGLTKPATLAASLLTVKVHDDNWRRFH